MLFSSNPAKVFDSEKQRDFERRSSLSPASRRRMGEGSNPTWILTVLSHSKEVSTVTKHVLKVQGNATVGDVCIAYMDALGLSGGSIVVQSKAGDTTGFALYSTRKMTGIPLNSAGQMNSLLGSALGQDPNVAHKATLHVFQARCADHWSPARASCCFSSLKMMLCVMKKRLTMA